MSDGGTFAPLHYLSPFSFEDTLNYADATAAFPSSAFHSSHRETRSVSWYLDNLERITQRHNARPSKGLFYVSRQSRTMRPSIPFSKEDLRVRGARARGSAGLSNGQRKGEEHPYERTRTPALRS